MADRPATFDNMGRRMRKRARNLPGTVLLLLLLAAPAFPDETIRVGAYQNPPKVFVTPDGRTTGIFPEILDSVAKQRGWKIEYIHGTWKQCLKRLESGKIDLMVDVAVSKERRERYDFSEEPVLVNWGTAFSRSDLRINSFLDMQDRTVAVMRGSIHTEGAQGIKALTAQFGVPCRFLEVDDYHQVLLLVDAKQADVGIVNRLYGTLHGGDYDISPTPIIFNPRVLAFATAKGKKRGNRLLDQVDESLAEGKQDPDSTYHQVLAYYLGGGSRKWEGQTQRYVRQLDLSPAELRWIREHPTIRFGVDPGFAPFEFLPEEGEYRGMAADFLNLVSQKTGLKFERAAHESWSNTIQAAKNREIDVLPCIGYSDERREFLAFSEPYLKFARVIVTRMDSSIERLEDLAKATVAVQKDSSHHAYLMENTAIEPQLHGTFQECLLALSRGEVDAVVGNLAVSTHHIRNLTLTNVKLAGYVSSEPQALAFGVRKDWPVLVGILNRALDSMTMQQRNAILAKWLPLPRAAATSLDLTQEEREWLLLHPRIRVGWDPSWAPIEFADEEGRPQGISMEYLTALEAMLGIQFDMSEPGDWQATYAKLKSRELDMSSCLAVTLERLEHLAFTESYLNSPVVLFARAGTPYICDTAELHGMRVAVVENYATDEWVRRDFPDLKLIRVPTIAAGFDLLEEDEVDVFIGSVLPGNYYLSKHRHRNIEVVGETPYTYKLRMAVRKDWPLFAGILQKALDAMPETDKTAFYRKWVWVRYEHGFDYTLLWKVVVIATLVIIVFAYWNRRLTREVRARKQAQAAVAEREDALRNSYTELKELEEVKENLTQMIVHDMRSPLAGILGALELMQRGKGNHERHLQMAHASALEATDMAQALLDIVRLETGAMPLNRVDLDIKATAVEAIQAKKIQAQLADVHLVLAGDSVQIKADPDILHRVLVNLIGNAIKASSQGTKVEVCTIDAGPRITVEVRDFGHGIPKKFHGALFEKFTTAEPAQQRKTSVGLGLAFCKLAIEAHGGEIMVESEEGKGSTFRFHLPKAG